MPNWVFNNMNVTGEKTAVEQFIADMSKPIHTFKSDPNNKWGHLDGQWEEYADVVFSFWNVIAPTDLESYFTGDTWYGWNNENWDTKWDARVDEKNVEQLDKGELSGGQYYVTYRFDTAWAPPTPVYHALAEKYPLLEFNIEWEEEQGFGAELVGVDGEISVTKEWDIPSSHADYVERDNEDSCICYYESDPEEMYDDCPPAIEANLNENKLIPITDLTSVS
jgi:hypothetical protein